MAHYKFTKDFEDSKKGVSVAAKYFEALFDAKVRELGKEEQSFGDLEISCQNKEPFFVEVKFDIMAAKTSNLCFELTNGKKATGILATKAHKIIFVVPNGDTFKLYLFDTANLLKYIQDTSNGKKFRLVSGGDNRRFKMLLIPERVIIEDKVAEEVVGANI